MGLTWLSLYTTTHPPHHTNSTSTKNNDPRGMKFCRQAQPAIPTTIQHNFNPTTFWGGVIKKRFDPKNILTQKSFLTKNFFGSTIFFDPKFFFNPNFFWPNIFWPKKFVYPKFFFTTKFYDIKIFFDPKFLTNFFEKIFSLHFQLEK